MRLPTIKDGVHDGYDGSFKPFEESIVRLHAEGFSATEISEMCRTVAVECGIEGPYSGWSNYPSAPIVRYILRRQNKKARTPAVRNAERAMSRSRRFGVARHTRVIDMGGPRGCWHEWTPEMQHREFARK